jgi:NADPH-dependent glutamate synthase beta subunit-like oxidoreductase
MATEKVKRTLAVVTTMTDDERAEFFKEIEKFRAERETVKRTIVANEWTKTARAVGWVSSGPTGSGCPYCGK